MIGDFAVNRLITSPYPAAEADLIFYVRPGGSDNAAGTTPATAFATFDRAVREMDLYSVNRSVILDVTDMIGANAITGNYVQQLAGTNLGGIRFDLDLTATSPNNFFSRSHRQIRSELALDTELEVTAQAFDATSGILQLTVADALVINELRGLFAVGSVLGEYGVIQSNSGGAGPNTIEVANIIGLTAPVGAYGPGAELGFGDALNPFEQAIYLLAMCDWNLQGLRIVSNGPKAASISVWPNAPVHFTLCEIEGLEINEGSGTVYLDACFLNGASFIQDGATLTSQQSYYFSTSFLCHGSGASGLNELVGNIFEACITGFGGGNAESRYSYQMENCRFASMSNEGAFALFGNSRIEDSTFNLCNKSAIVATNQVVLLLVNVQGVGNTGFGCEASYGAIVRNSGGTAVTGTTNDISVGALGANTWAATPLTDLDQLVRVGA
jgi:hypothetical protein